MDRFSSCRPPEAGGRRPLYTLLRALPTAKNKRIGARFGRQSHGTTLYGGSHNNSSCIANCGIVFDFSPAANGAWTEYILYEFTGGTDGGKPFFGLVPDTSGNL